MWSKERFSSIKTTMCSTFSRLAMPPPQTSRYPPARQGSSPPVGEHGAQLFCNIWHISTMCDRLSNKWQQRSGGQMTITTQLYQVAPPGTGPSLALHGGAGGRVQELS